MLKDCPPGKIRNPVTNRCVKKDGKIGLTIHKSSSKTPQNKFTEKEIRQYTKEMHPDMYISKAAINYLKTLTISENILVDVINLAGDICTYDRKKKTISVEDLQKAKNIQENGLIKKELDRLNKIRLARIDKMLGRK
jgi:histone H3/H4